MENKKTISYLQAKTWYRALKVFYILFFLVVLIAYNFFIWSAIYQATYSTYAPTYTDYSKLSFASKITPVQAPIQPIDYSALAAEYGATISNVHSTNPSNSWDAFDKAMTQSQQVSQPTILNIIMYFILGNLIILLLFEAVRRAFYYIVLGAIKPKKQ